MSYILDALKRADAERDRGQVPGLNAQALPVAPAPTPALRPWLWLGGGAAVAAVGLVLWRMNAAPPAPVAAVTPPAAAVPAAPAAAVVAAAPAVASAPAPAPRPPAPAPVAKSAPVLAPSASAPPVVAPVAPAAPASAPAPRVLTLAELPETTRAAIPKLTVSGSVYSGNAAQRMLIVNGQVLNEGSTVAPDLVLESIGPRSAVLNLRGTRVRLDY